MRRFFMATLEKHYEPDKIEQKWYKKWQDAGAFKPKGTGKPFVIVIPPPNITGKLHMGHALNMTLQDISTRFHRMKGFDTLWLPGEDHAGIATQNVVEKNLREEGSSKDEIGREAFVERTWKWADEYRGHIREQIRYMGCSVDWSRDRFTLDEGLNKAVRKVFVKLYEKGLIYKGKYIVNWCPRCHTVLSDEEVEHKDESSNLWHFRYPVKDSDEYVVIATTRPETMLGDSAVAVNPADERYKDLIGRTLVLPIVNREIPVIEDQYVDREFGTGAVKVTPAHDPNDYQMGVRHDLQFFEVVDESGYMNEQAGAYKGMPIKEARKAVVEKMEELGLLIKTEDYQHSVGHCYRCDTTIDPRLSDQWFVRMKPLAKEAIKVVDDEEIAFYPPRWKKVYLNWMNEVRDWCISRQLWWGHRIPVWYCEDCGHVNVAEETPEKCEECGSGNLRQDPDVLDTWFSSGLWPFSTLGWPGETEDLQKYYPTTVLITAFDIIFFWVARMIVMGLEFMDKKPFKDVYITQLIRDKKGRKMSKSLGNGIDPIEVVGDYGADAMRFTLSIFAGQGRDINLDVKSIQNYKHFANKIWNATRFALMNLEGFEKGKIDINELTLSDKWILNRLEKTIRDVTKGIEEYDYNLASKAIFEFFWNEFCDWYIESIKPFLYQDYPESVQQNTRNVLLHTLDVSLRLLHPFMPFITEEIWQMLPGQKDRDFLMIAAWPESGRFNGFEEQEKQFKTLMEHIRGIRNVRAELNLAPSKKLDIAYMNKDSAVDITPEEKIYLQALANVDRIDIVDSKPPKTATAYVTPAKDLYVTLGEMVDWEEERKRLKKSLKKAEKDVKHFEKKLSNSKFMANAKEEVIEETKLKHQKAIQNRDRIKKLAEDFE